MANSTLLNTTLTVPLGVPGGAHTVGEVIELLGAYVRNVSETTEDSLAYDNGESYVNLLAAIKQLVSDRDVLLSAMTTLSTAQQSVFLLEYVHGVARAAIQKVTK